jgi:hypothetical protein
MNTEINNKIEIKKVPVDNMVLEKISDTDYELEILLLSEEKRQIALQIIFGELNINTYSDDDEVYEDYIERKLIEVYRKCKNNAKFYYDYYKNNEEEKAYKIKNKTFEEENNKLKQQLGIL